MQNKILEAFEAKNLEKNKIRKHPKFRPGDTLRVHYKIEEGTKGSKKFRIQNFEGVCIKVKKGTINGSFTIRKMGANNVGVERTFPMESPFVDGIDLLASGRVRRSRLFYLRGLRGKAARIKSRRLAKKIQTKSETIEKAAPAAEEAAQ